MTLLAPLQVDEVNPRSGTTLVEQRFVHIDNKLAALAESMRVLRSQRNSLAHISCLPPEILATVFGHIVEEESFRYYPHAYKPPACLKVTHVCGYWRKVALECPSLWAVLHRPSARWIDIMLERSKGAALVVNCNVSTLSKGCLEKLLSHLPRIKILQLESYASNIVGALDHLSSQPAPLLQAFEFSVIGGTFYETPGLALDAIFQGQAPQLRSLQSGNCAFSCTSHIFSGLRTLCLKGIRATLSYTLPEILPALRRMPGLERLTIEQYDILGGSGVLFDRVPLARLRSIVLKVTIQTAMTLFTHLTLPADAKIALNLTKIEGHQNFSELFSAMDKVPGKFGPVIRSVHAAFAPVLFLVQFSRSMECKRSPSWNDSDDDIPLSIQFSPDSPAAIHPSIMFDICRMTTHDKIHTLSVSSSYQDLDRNFWRSGSTNFPELEEVRVTSGFIGGLLTALRSEGMQSADVTYQSLRVLDLENIDFLEDDADDLYGIIDMRGELCTSLSVLRLTCCRGLMARDVELLEDVVDDVDWDGNEESLSESEYYASDGCQCVECRDVDYVF